MAQTLACRLAVRHCQYGRLAPRITPAQCQKKFNSTLTPSQRKFNESGQHAVETLPLEGLMPLMHSTAIALKEMKVEDAREARFVACKLIIRTARGLESCDAQLRANLCSSLLSYMDEVAVNTNSMEQALFILYSCSLIGGRTAERAFDAFHRRFFPQMDLVRERGLFLLLDALYTFDARGTGVHEAVGKIMSKVYRLAQDMPHDVRIQAWMLAAGAKKLVPVRKSEAMRICESVKDSEPGSLQSRVLEYLALGAKAFKIRSLSKLLRDAFTMNVAELNPFTVRVVLAYLSSLDRLPESCLVALQAGIEKKHAGCQVGRYPAQGVMHLLQTLCRADECDARVRVALSVLSSVPTRVHEFAANESVMMAEAIFRLDLPWTSTGRLVEELVSRAALGYKALEPRGVAALCSVLLHASENSDTQQLYASALRLLSEKSGSLAKSFSAATPGEQGVLMLKLQRLRLRHEALIGALVSQMEERVSMNEDQVIEPFAALLHMLVVTRMLDLDWVSSQMDNMNVDIACLPKFKKVLFVWCMAACKLPVEAIANQLGQLPVGSGTFFNHMPGSAVIALQELHWLLSSAGYQLPEAFGALLRDKLRSGGRFQTGVSGDALAKLTELLGNDKVARSVRQHSQGVSLPGLVLLLKDGSSSNALNAMPLSDFTGNLSCGRAIRASGAIPCVVIPVNDDRLVTVVRGDADEADTRAKRLVTGGFSVLLLVLRMNGYHPVAVPASELMDDPATVWQDICSLVAKQDELISTGQHAVSAATRPFPAAAPAPSADTEPSAFFSRRDSHTAVGGSFRASHSDKTPVPARRPVRTRGASSSDGESKKRSQKPLQSRLHELVAHMDMAVARAEADERKCLNVDDPNDVMQFALEKDRQELNSIMGEVAQKGAVYEHNRALLPDSAGLGGYALPGPTRHKMLSDPKLPRLLTDATRGASGYDLYAGHLTAGGYTVDKKKQLGGGIAGQTRLPLPGSYEYFLPSDAESNVEHGTDGSETDIDREEDARWQEPEQDAFSAEDQSLADSDASSVLIPWGSDALKEIKSLPVQSADDRLSLQDGRDRRPPH
eukprot:scpid33605/ scgid16356/ 